MSGQRKEPKLAHPHPISPLPSMLIRLHLLKKGTSATDHGLDAIFAPRGQNVP